MVWVVGESGHERDDERGVVSTHQGKSEEPRETETERLEKQNSRKGAKTKQTREVEQ